nr:glycosyl hydrolase family 28 protein [Klebsiella variicola]
MKNRFTRQIHMLGGFIVFIAFMNFAQGGDIRNVSQPEIPLSCKVLKADKSVDSTRAIQNALDSCAKGRAVLLSISEKYRIFYSGPLNLPSGVNLWVDKGATLAAIANPSLFDTGGMTCGKLDHSGKGCRPFIQVKNASDSGIYGLGTIDGQGNSIMYGQNQTWWQLANEAKNSLMRQNAPRLIQIDNSKNITLFQITLKNSPNFHVVGNNTDGLTLWGIKIDTPASARNTDGFDPMGSKNVTLAHSSISTGDDNVAIKAGNRESSHISILDNHFGSGHGMSIGSEINKGVSDVTVNGLIFNSTTNGLRIKSDRSRGGLVAGVTYKNICMQNVKNPISLDTHYNINAGGQLIPEFRNILFSNIRVLSAGNFVFNGYSNTRPARVTLRDVHITDGSSWRAKNAIIQGKVAKDAAGTCE